MSLAIGNSIQFSSSINRNLLLIQMIEEAQRQKKNKSKKTKKTKKTKKILS